MEIVTRRVETFGDSYEDKGERRDLETVMMREERFGNSYHKMVLNGPHLHLVVFLSLRPSSYPTGFLTCRTDAGMQSSLEGSADLN